MTNKLSCQDKYEIVKLLKSKLKSQRQLARQYNVSKSAIQRIKSDYDTNIICDDIINVSTKEDGQTSRLSRSCDLDKKVFEIFQRLRHKNFPLNGQSIKKIVLNVAKRMQLTSFKASNEWLEKFRGRHQLDFKILCGELKLANLGVDDFKNILIEKMKIYTPSEIYNCHETSLYYRSIAKKVL